MIGRSENELLQRGRVGFTPLHCDGMNPSKGLGNGNLKVIRDVYNSIPSLSLTLQHDHVHDIKLTQAASTDVTKRRQINHGECVGEWVEFLSGKQGSFIAKYVREE